MNDERNFRSLYYNKVGCKSVEEKKSLEILFKEKILDKNKLGDFCSRFSVPFVYRSYLWKVLFGIIPVHKSCQEFVMKQRELQYHDLLNALKALNTLTSESTEEEKFLKMWLLEKYQLNNCPGLQSNIEPHQNRLAIIRTFITIFDSDVDIYWIAKAFFNYIRTWSASIPILVEKTKTFLLKEDNTLYSHLLKTDLLNQIPMDTWFSCCFAGVIHDSAIVRIWDKMIGGSYQQYQMLVIVCSTLLTTLRRVLLSCMDITQLISCVKSVNMETSDVIVNKSLELYQAQGRFLPVPAHRRKRSHKPTH